jgi:hypothetical protein
MNAELGKNYDVDKMINWTFEPFEPLRARADWGAITGTWGGYDVHGLIGSMTDQSGYAFAMETHQHVAALVPVVRYYQSYARDIGKWVLNAANAARLFYSNALDAAHQANWNWCNSYDPNACISYEALRATWASNSPYASGDPLTRWGWGNTDLGLYSSSHVGYIGGILKTTNVEKILQLDLLKTDWFHDDAYPSYLYYNPYDTSQMVDINVGPNTVNIYDTVSATFLKTAVTGQTSLTIDADSAVVAVLAPVGGTVTYNNTNGVNQMLIDGVVVDYQANHTYDTCAQVQASPYRLAADIDGDCRVGMTDLAVIAGEWLNTACGWCQGANLDDDNDVDLSDFAEFTSQYKQCNDPQGGLPCAPNW